MATTNPNAPPYNQSPLPPPGLPYTPAPTISAPAPAPAVPAAPPVAAPPKPATAPKFTSADIKNHAVAKGWVNADGTLNRAVEGSDRLLYDEAARYNVSAGELDAAFGWNPNQTASYGAARGWAPLPEQSAAPAPAVDMQQSAAAQQGIINSAAPMAQTPTLAPPTQMVAPTPVAPTTAQVDPKQTTRGIIDSMLDENGTLLQRTRALAREEANSRGLLSSSIAADAAAGAVMDRVAGVAANDAGIYANQRIANMNAANEMANANANRAMQAAQFNAGASNEFALTQFGAGSQAALQASASQQRKQEMSLDQLMQLDRMQVQSKLQEGTLGLQSYLDMQKMGYGSTLSMREMGYAGSLDLMKMAQANGYDIEKMARSQGYTLEQMSAALGMDLQKMARGQELDLEKIAVANGNDINKMALDFGYRQQLQEAGAKMDADLRKDLISYEASLNNSMTGKGALANLAGRYAEMFDVARRDPNLDAADKDRALAQLRADFRANASVVASVYGIDATEYLAMIGSGPAPAAAPATEEGTLTRMPVDGAFRGG